MADEPVSGLSGARSTAEQRPSDDENRNPRASRGWIMGFLEASRIFQSMDIQRDRPPAIVKAPDLPSDPPTILRTVYKRTVAGLASQATFVRNLTVDEYEKYRDSASGSAIELVKEVRYIPQSGLSASDSTQINQHEIVDRVESEKMIIRSPELIGIIKDVVKYWPTSAYYDNQTKLEINKPYRSICVYLAEFEKRHASLLVQVEDSKKLGAEMQKEASRKLAELNTLIEEVNRVQRIPMERERQRYEGDTPKATFEMLFMLYKPGTEVFVSTEDFQGFCRVRLLFWVPGAILGVGQDDPYASVDLNLWYLDHDGSFLSPRHLKIPIQRFSGEKSITTLPAYPTEYMDKAWEVGDEHVARGRKYLELVKNDFKHCWYDGSLSRHDSSPFLSFKHSKYRGKVVIDPAYHFMENGRVNKVVWMADAQLGDLQTKPLSAERPFKLDPKKPDMFVRGHFALLHHWVRGFTVGTRGTRDWAWFAVDALQVYNNDTSLIETVALSRHDDDMDHIKALTFNPAQRNMTSAATARSLKTDGIMDKGEGRVILLHGLPGLGKTYTAECIVEWSGRPLLRLTCTELGIDPAALERSLNLQMRRAERWQAIVLIDETDIFLERRNQDMSIKKEAVISAFLRALEYFSGILFLTTNRVSAFDPAALDRMTLTVWYEYPDTDVKRRIREKCMERLTEGGQFEFTMAAREAFSQIDNAIATSAKVNNNDGNTEKQRGERTEVDDDYKWSGREINNVAKHAAMLAQYEDEDNTGKRKVRIDGQHIRRAIDKVQATELNLFQATRKNKAKRQLDASQR